jgi:ATP-binding cassette, subfamily B, bacterial CvaB/MchF/RaxB
MATGPKRAIRVVLQSAVAECGLACATMLLEAFERPVSLQQVRQTHDASIRGSNLRDILGVLRDYGLATRPLRIELARLGDVRLPCILHWSFDHFVVLERWDRRSATIIDPSSGRLTVDHAVIDQKFTGVALEVTEPIAAAIATDGFEKLQLRHILPNIASLSGLLVQVAILTVLLNAGALILPLFVKYVIDTIGEGGVSTLILATGAGFLTLALLQGINRHVRGAVLIALRRRLSRHMSHKVFDRLIWLNHSVVERRSSGTIAANYRSVFALSDTLGEDVISALIDALAAFVVAAIVFYYDVWIGLATLLSIGGYTAWTALRNRGAKSRMGQVLAQEGREAGFFVETINRLQAIRLFQAEPWRSNAFATIHQRVEDARDDYAQWNNRSRSIGEGLLQVSWVALIGIAAYRLGGAGFDVGLFSALIVWIGLATTRARDAVSRFTQIDWLESHVDRLSDIVLSPSDYVESAPATLAAPPQRIGCAGIGVRYAPNLPVVFERLSLEVRMGEWLTIIGSSGEGKTTLAKALTGLLPVDEGTLTVDGEPAGVEGIRTIRRHVGAVMQNDGLLAGSIRDNITFFDQTPDLDFLVECARLAEVADDIAAMPMGYDSVIGEQGAGLSAGQGQRLMLARALYKRPRFLVLDEFTANIDEQCEQRVIDNLRTLGVGVVAIAHRSNVIHAADRVLELKQAQIKPRFPSPGVSELRAG